MYLILDILVLWFYMFSISQVLQGILMTRVDFLNSITVRIRIIIVKKKRMRIKITKKTKKKQ